MIIKHPISTEKSVKLIQGENKLVFVVDRAASKRQIKEEIELLFNAKVLSVNTIVTPEAKKRAIVQFSPETPAIDIATKLGLM
jgi:large subunit ribosomal protein L23